MAAEGHQSLRRLSLDPGLGTGIAACAAGLVVGLVVAAGVKRVGPVATIAPAVAAAALILLWYPRTTLSILLVGAGLLEASNPGLLPPVNSFYIVIKASLTPIDVLLFLTIGGLLLKLAREGRRLEFPGPLSGPLALLGAATLAGIITASAAQAEVSNGDLYHRAMTDFYLIGIPVLIVNLFRSTDALRTFMAVAAAIAAFKGLSGLYAAVTGVGTILSSEGGESASYLEPAPNIIMLTYVLGVVAALVRRVQLPAWALAGAPLAFLALLFSYRRSFWIAALLALIVVVIVASRHRGRAVFTIAGIALVLAFVASATIGSSETSSAPLLKRAQALTPTGLEENRGDRYRNDERANVIANLEEEPLTGRGLGVPWEVKQPLAELHDRTYVHFALLWFWLALGPLGVLAYVLLMGVGLWVARTVWNRHPDQLVQIGAIAVFGGIVSVVIVELTTTFTTVDARFTIMLAAGIGWLAAAWRDIPRPR